MGAMSLPLVSSAYSEVSRVTSPYMESTYNKVSPVVETTLGMVSPVVDSVKTKVEEQVIPHIPASITETVQSVQTYAIDNVTAAVEKVDHFACGGIDQLTEKVPQLKEATPEFEEIKSSVSTFVKKDGSEKAKKIEEASIVGAIIEVSGLQEFLAFFGFHLKTSEPATESDDAKKTKTSEPIKPSLDVKKTYVDVKKTAVNKTE